MVNDDAQLLPLEKSLKEIAKKAPHEFPNSPTDYFRRYCSVKEWLIDNVYKHIGSALSTEGGIYTDHGMDHFNEVIRYAGLMIGADPLSGNISKTIFPYEIYVLLMAILLHDAGNVFGRKEHEKNAYQLLCEMGPLAGNDNVEKKAIANVAQAHGGKTATGDRDTIGILEENPQHGPVKFRARVLAGILRFADEISEHRGRGARLLLDRNTLSKKSEVYHIYAEAITSVSVDIQGKTIYIIYDIPVEDVKRLWGKDKDQTYLTNEILLRLEKMYLEKLYCGRFMFPLFIVERIKATVNIRGDQMDILAEYPIILEESGYPTSNEKLTSRYPELEGIKIHQRFR